MTTTINASTSSGLVATPDNSGAIALQNNGVTGLNVSATGQITAPLNVCFSAQANSTTNATIVYSSAYVNIGSGLNTSTGIFTAPVAGTYMFTVHGLANGGSGDISMQVNGTTRAACRGNNTTASAALIYTLAVNDTVKCVASSASIYGDGSGWSIFTGRLIQ